MNKPLAGVKVLDLSAVISGPLATSILCDQGADVIKIEAPGGDLVRKIGPVKNGVGAAFVSINRGKRGMTLDLKQAVAREVVLQLAAQSDVVIENARPGVMDRLGLGARILCELNPRLIHLSISGYGPTGPMAGVRTYDAVIQAASGMCASHPNPDTGEPMQLTTYVCDKVTALTAAQAISSALYAREKTGKGQSIQLSMLDAALAFHFHDAFFNHVYMGEDAPIAMEVGVGARLLKTQNGYLAVMTPQQAEFAGLCRSVGRADLIDDPRFVTLADRGKHRVELYAELNLATTTLDTDELFAALLKADVPAGRVNQRAEVLTDPQVVHNDSIVEIDHGELGRVRLARGAARFGNEPPPIPGPAAMLGEHTVEVLRELGLDEGKISALFASGAAS